MKCEKLNCDNIALWHHSGINLFLCDRCLNTMTKEFKKHFIRV